MEIVNDDVWVFLSHSHKDYDKVIQVRNLLEKRNIRPIMFFLKCLENDSEVDSLIKREIDSRYRFILCDSKNAQGSMWVQKEVEYIKKEKNRSYETIDLDKMSISEIDQKLQEYEKRLSMSIFYSEDRRTEYSQIVDESLNFGFRMKSLCIDDIDINSVINLINEQLSNGYVCLLVNIAAVQKLAIPISDLGRESDRLLFIQPNEKNLFLKIIQTLNFEQAMHMSQFAWGRAKEELLEYAIYNGGTPTMQFILANIYENGLYGIKQDLHKALGLYEDMLHYDGIATYNHIKRVTEKINKKE